MAEKEAAVNELLYKLCGLYSRDKGKTNGRLFEVAHIILGSSLSPLVHLDECRLTERIQKKLVKGGNEAAALLFLERYQRLCSQPLLQSRHALLCFLLALMQGSNTNGLSQIVKPSPSTTSLLLEAPGLCSGADPKGPGYSSPSLSSGLGSSLGSTSRDTTLRPSTFSSADSGRGISSADSGRGDSVTLSSRDTTATSRSGLPFTSTPAVSGMLPPHLSEHIPATHREAWSGPTLHPTPSPLQDTGPHPTGHPAPRVGLGPQDTVAGPQGAEKEGVTEGALLRDLIFVFQDIEGKYIRYNHKEEGFRILPQYAVSGAVRELCHKLAELGWLHRRIRHFIQSKTKDRSQGLVMQSFCSALSQELTEYYRLVAVLDAQVQQVGVASGDGVGGMTLRRLLVWTHDPRERLQWLAILVDGCKRLKGGALVSALYHYGWHGDPAVRALVTHLLTQVYLPLHRMLHTWVFDGVLADKSNEFFVACDDSSKPEKLWRSKYTLRQPMLPAFISPALAQKILTIGKSINFLHQICEDHTQLGGASLRSWYLNNQGQSSFELMTGASLKKIVDCSYHETSKYLLQVLHSKYHLVEHFKAMRRYLLLGQGDFIRHLMDLLDSDLSKPASTLYLHNLTGILEAAIRATNAQYDSSDALKRLDVRLLDLSPGDQGWDVFSLHYHVDGPISTVFTGEAMLKYLRVFNFLWRSKRMEYCLASMWREQTACFRVLQVLPEMSHVLHRSHLLVSAMNHFISQLQYYITFEVLECSWKLLLDQVTAAQDLDAVIEAHDKFLDKITCQCLLDHNSQPILTRLRAVYDLVIMFQQKQAAMFGAGLREVERREGLEVERDRRAQQGEWRVTSAQEKVEESKRKEFAQKKAHTFTSDITLLHDSFKDMVGELMDKLKGHPEQSLQYLDFRLDFNEHYSAIRNTQ